MLHVPWLVGELASVVSQRTDLVPGGNRWLTRIERRASAAPPWFERLAALTALGFVPLLVAPWLV